jgi:hypothetical protein
VIQFLVAEGVKLTCIDEHLFKVHGEAAVDVSTVTMGNFLQNVGTHQLNYMTSRQKIFSTV